MPPDLNHLINLKLGLKRCGKHCGVTSAQLLYCKYNYQLEKNKSVMLLLEIRVHLVPIDSQKLQKLKLLDFQKSPAHGIAKLPTPQAPLIRRGSRRYYTS